MTDINVFVSKWNGKHVDADGSKPNSPTYDQCVDLIVEWQKENHWPVIDVNAVDFWKLPHIGYTKVANNPKDPNQFPPAGAIAVLNEGLFGHVVLVLPGTNGHHLVAFQQNAPQVGVMHGTIFVPGSPCNVATYNYIKPTVLGWLVKQ